MILCENIYENESLFPTFIFVDFNELLLDSV